MRLIATNVLKPWTLHVGGHLEVCQLLARYDADVNSQDNRKVSVLMAAFRKGHVKTVKWIVRHVTQFPSESDSARFISTLLNEKVNYCHEFIQSLCCKVPSLLVTSHYDHTSQTIYLSLIIKNKALLTSPTPCSPLSLLNHKKKLTITTLIWSCPFSLQHNKFNILFMSEFVTASSVRIFCSCYALF